MDAQTVTIIIAIATGWAATVAVFMPMYMMAMRRLDQTNIRIDETNAVMAQLGARLDARLDQTNDRIGQLADRLDARIDQTNARIDETNASVARLGDRLDARIDQTNALVARLAYHRHDVDGGVVFEVPTPDD